MTECRNCGGAIRSGSWCQKRECLAAKSLHYYYRRTAGVRANLCEKCGNPLDKRNPLYRMHVGCRTTKDRLSSSCLGCGASIRIDNRNSCFCCVKCLGLARKLGKILRSLEQGSKEK